ncbi:hypothetical protein BK025_12345 [Sodalis sp. TME1]|nr:hypothetical protein BK025_12345 [Sodalis sp. TME1]
MSPSRQQHTAQLLRLLGHPVRLHIALLLHQLPQTVSALETQLNIRQPSLSQHLAALRAAGLVYASRDAKSVTYALSEGLSSRLVAALSALVSQEALNPSALQPRQSEALAYSPRQGDELVFATLRSPNET